MGTQFLYMLEAICLTALLIIALIAVDPMRVEKAYYSEPTQGEITNPCIDDYLTTDWEDCK